MDSKIIDLSRYTLSVYARPYWDGHTVYLESVHPLSLPDGTRAPLSLLYAIEDVLDVRSSDLQTVYEAGKDYRVERGKLVIPAGSAIPVMPYEEHYSPVERPGIEALCKDGGYTVLYAGGTLHHRQIAVSYTHRGMWNGYRPPRQGVRLPHLQETIRRKGALNILFYGDSLTAGGDSSVRTNMPPFAPRWAEMFTEYLLSLGVSATYNNTAVGGRDSVWGLEEVQERVVAYKPDLLVLAFGMNELGNCGHNNPALYKANLLTIIRKLREATPDAEVILVGSIQANGELQGLGGDRMQMTEKLYELREELDGVAVADMTRVHDYLLTRKAYRDMSGNNVNHVNDFLARAYLHTLMETIAVETPTEKFVNNRKKTVDNGFGLW